MKGNIGHLLLSAGLTFVALWIYDSVSKASASSAFPSLT